jgi:Mrp family chromosome partitioning ATPase
MFLASPNQTQVFRTVPSSDVATQAADAAQLMRSDAVLDRARELTGNRWSRNTVKDRLTVSPSSDSHVVTIRATGPTATQAQELANAEGQAFIDVQKSLGTAQKTRSIAVLNEAQASLQKEYDGVTAQVAKRTTAAQAAAAGISDPTLRARQISLLLSNDAQYQALFSQQQSLASSLADVRGRITQVQVDASLGAGVDHFAKADKPSHPTQNTARNVALAAALGLLIGAALAWRRTERSQGLDPQAVSRALEAPMLAHLERDATLRRKPLAVADFAGSAKPGADFKAIVSALAPHLARRRLQKVFVTSAAPGEGRSAVALNLAAAADYLGYESVLIDGDVESPELSTTYGQSRPATFDSPVVHIPYGANRALPFLPASRPDTSISALREGTMIERLGRGGETNALRIIDAGWGLSDPTTIRLAAAGGAFLVVVSRAATMEDLRTLKSRADLAGVPIIGFVLNDPVLRGRGRRGSARPSQQLELRKGQVAPDARLASPA